jgi:ATP-dependent DNA helicase RecQ
MLKHLKSVYGYNEFRPFQEEIVNDVLEGTNSIVVFPTGGGKSLCYQFPATFTGKHSIVVSPLISLMEDQQLHLEKSGISSICLNGNTSISGKSFLRKSNKPSSLEKYSVIYCTPEYITSNINVFKNLENIGLFAIDEAHCLSQWGHDFRTSYMKLNIIKKEFHDIPIMLLTATATPVVLEDMFDHIGVDDANQYCLGTKRENLAIKILQKSGDIMEDLKGEIDKDKSTIIYTQTRKKTEEISALLNCYGYDSRPYHAGMSTTKKTQTHLDFVKDKVKLLVATVCFGMGIDKPDIRKIINYGSPCDLETYYQEIGRAGRDGVKSSAVLFHDESDNRTNMFLISKSAKKEHRLKLLNIFNTYINNELICRQSMLEYYFDKGKLTDSKKSYRIYDVCGICDNCKPSDRPSGNKVNIIKEARIATGFVLSLPVNYGKTKIIDALRGSKAAKVSNLRVNPFFGKGSNHSVDIWKKIFKSLECNNFLESKFFNKYTVLGGGSKSVDGLTELYVNIPGLNKTHESNPYLKYKKIRDKLAIDNNVPPYMIANDMVILEISKVQPKTMKELIFIDGVSMTFASTYGVSFIPLTKTYNSTSDSYTLYNSGKSILDISKIRGLKDRTIENHIIQYWKQNPTEIDYDRVGLSDSKQADIAKAIFKVGRDRLRPIKDLVKNNVTYFQINVFMAAK